MTPRALLLCLGTAFVALGANCDGVSTCECFPCTSAIDLQVFDSQGNALGDAWTAEATVDGVAVEDIVNCDPSARFGNDCSFGQVTGLYRITVRSPGFQTKQIAARFAAKTGEDCCRCLQATTVHAVLLEEGQGQ